MGLGIGTCGGGVLLVEATFHSMGFDPWGARRDGESNNTGTWNSLSDTQRHTLISNSLKLANFSQPITTRGYMGMWERRLWRIRLGLDWCCIRCCDKRRRYSARCIDEYGHGQCLSIKDLFIAL